MSPAKFFLINLPSPEQQVQIIKDLERTTTLSPDAPAHLISHYWLATWKDSVGYNVQPSGRTVHPVDNDNLLSEGKLRQDIAEGVDFDIITEPVWEKFQTWYTGGPDIPRNVEYDEAQQRNVVIVHVPIISVYFKSEMHNIECSLYKSIGELKEKACESFHVDPSKARLCDFQDKLRQAALDDHKTLSSYQIGDRHLLLLEVQRDDGNWITVTHQKPMFPNSPSLQTIAEVEAEPGVCGLKNIGNSCYMNAALQCLSHNVVLYDFFLRDSNWKYQINYENPIGTHGNLVEAFVEFLHEVWSGMNTSIAPRLLKNAISSHAHQFKGDHQHDAHELLMILLDSIHEDLNRVHDKPYLDAVFGNESNDLETSKLSWERHKKRNDSVIVDNFHGLLRSRLICPNCKKTTIVFDPYLSLTIPLPEPRQLTPAFTFIPYDLSQPRIKLQLSLVMPATMLETADAISTKLQRNIDGIVIAEREPPNAIELEWKRQSINSSLHVDKRNCEILVFELPKHDTQSLFVPVRLMAPIQTEKPFGLINSELDAFFLVELPHDHPTPEEVSEICEKRFSYFFRPNEKPISDELEEFKSHLQSSPKFKFDQGQKMITMIIRTREMNNDSFDRRRNLTYITSRRIEVTMNPDIIRDENNFSWGSLRQVIHQEVQQQEGEAKKKITLEECLEMFSSDDTLDANNKWHCPHCDTSVCANKKMEVWETPNVLIIHLKRFLHTASSQYKIDIFVKYPEILDMAPYIIGPKVDEEDCKYKLFAVIAHNGGLSGGHYVAHTYHHIKKKWYLFNDELVKASRPAAAHSRDAYVLFYVKTPKKQSRKTQKKKVNNAEDPNAPKKTQRKTKKDKAPVEETEVISSSTNPNYDFLSFIKQQNLNKQTEEVPPKPVRKKHQVAFNQPQVDQGIPPNQLPVPDINPAGSEETNPK